MHYIVTSTQPGKLSLYPITAQTDKQYRPREVSHTCKTYTALSNTGIAAGGFHGNQMHPFRRTTPVSRQAFLACHRINLIKARILSCSAPVNGQRHVDLVKLLSFLVTYEKKLKPFGEDLGLVFLSNFRKSSSNKHTHTCVCVYTLPWS